VVEGHSGKPPLTKAELLEELQPGTAGSVAQEVQAKLGEVEASTKLVPNGPTQKELEEAIAAHATRQKLPKTRLLKRSEATTYHTPNNPVVLIAGAGASGIVPPPQTTLCRFPQQLVGGFEFNRKKVTASSAGLKIPRPDLSRVSGAPWPAALAEALVTEAYFTNPGNAAAISAAVPGSDPEGIEQAMTAAPIGILPSGSVDAWTENAWHPLLLIWAVSYYPIPLGTEKSNWVFEAGRYVWNGEGAAQEPLSLSGTIQLGTAAVFNMASRLEAFLEANPRLAAGERDELEKLLEFVTTQENDWDLLSQALDGFNEQLQLGIPGVFANPSLSEAEAQSPLSTLIGPSPGYPPGLGVPPVATLPASEFQPLRGGQFCFTELTLVDEWGQALQPIDPKSTGEEIVFMPAEMSPTVNSSPVRFTVTASDGEDAPTPTTAAGTGSGDGSGIAIEKLVPSSAPAGSGPLTLEVEGSGFAAGATVTWNGLPLATELVGATKLTATVPTESLALPDAVAVAVGMDRHVRAEATESYIQIPPAIPQPARLVFEMLSVGSDTVTVGPLAPDANPICGWILPNHLDASLMAYLPGGEPLGELSLGVGLSSAKAEPCWTTAPGALWKTLPEVEANVPHLGKMLAALARQGETVFASFLAAIDETLWTTVPAGAAFASDLVTLVGCPLALVRAHASFDLLSGPRRDPSWQYTFAPQPAGLDACSLAIELGGRAWLDDGLIGYFEAEEYDKLFVVAQAEAPEGGYLNTIGESDNHLSIAADGSARTRLSLLLDPRAPVHASTPALPGASLALPPRLVEAALAELEVTFRLNGVLTGSETTAPSDSSGVETTVQLPLPNVNAGRWSWTEKDATGWTSYAASTTDASARLGDVPPVLRRGLLRLSDFVKPKPQGKDRE
jgi:hypothetical protein